MLTSLDHHRPARLVDPLALASRVAPRVRAERAERRVRQAAERSRVGTRQREELIVSVNHELRTPLSSIVGYTELLLAGEAGALNEHQTRMLERMAGSAEQLVDLVEQLLRVTTQSRGEGHPEGLAGAVLEQVAVLDPRGALPGAGVPVRPA